MKTTRMRTSLGFLIVLITLATAAPAGAEDVWDPWQGMNRKTFWFNEQFDRLLVSPIARGWKFITPEFARTGVRNAFANLRMPITLANDILQAKPGAAVQDIARILVNSTVGIVGLIDVASMEGIDRNQEDFGQTLGYWGLPAGPYFVLPVLGPSSPRGTIGLAGDTACVPHLYFLPWWANGLMTSTRIVNERSFYLGEVTQARRESLDFYLFARDTYVQYREKQIADEDIVGEEEEDDLYYFDDELEEMGDALEESDDE